MDGRSSSGALPSGPCRCRPELSLNHPRLGAIIRLISSHTSDLLLRRRLARLRDEATICWQTHLAALFYSRSRTFCDPCFEHQGERAQHWPLLYTRKAMASMHLLSLTNVHCRVLKPCRLDCLRFGAVAARLVDCSHGSESYSAYYSA